MLVNFSNHPSASWSAEQISVAEKQFGGIADIAFPNVPADADEEFVSGLADKCCAEIRALGADAAMVQGEMSLSFAVAARLSKSGITPLCACSERVCETTFAEDGSTVRRSVFKFIRFRQYIL